MGMHFGLIAAKVPLSQFRAAFSQTWPEMEVAASADGFGNADDIWSWKSANERFVSARNWTKENPGSEVYIFCQDGSWAVLMDFSYVLAADQEALEQLSTRFGSVLSFIVETAGGCAYFWSYESGKMRRMIQNIDGKLTSSGARLPQEEGIDVGSYYMEETERLMQAFGLSRPEDLPVASTAVAIAAIDRTDYTRHTGAISGEKPSAQEPSSRRAKPWWKFW
jgi:hypothetical protein